MRSKGSFFPRPVSDITMLRRDICRYLSTGTTTTAYSTQELFNVFCVGEGKTGFRVYDSDTLTLAISELLEEGVLEDFGSGWFGRPRPQHPKNEEWSFV